MKNQTIKNPQATGWTIDGRSYFGASALQIVEAMKADSHLPEATGSLESYIQIVMGRLCEMYGYKGDTTSTASGLLEAIHECDLGKPITE